MNICLCNHYAHDTSLTPPLCFIDVPMQSQEYKWFCMYVKGIDIASFKCLENTTYDIALQDKCLENMTHDIAEQISRKTRNITL
jgi:hypothetical protein